MSSSDEPQPEQDAVNAGMAVAYDSEIQGPMKTRSCTDVTILIIFAITVATWIAMGFWVIYVSDFTTRLLDHESQTTIDGKWTNNEKNHLVLARTFNVFMLPVFLALVVSMIAAFIMMLLMRWFSVGVAYIFVMIILLLTLTIAILHLTTSYKLLHVAIGEFGIIICFFIIVLFETRLKFAVALIKESTRAIFSMWSTLLIPIISAIFKLAVLEFFTVVLYSLWYLKEVKSGSYSDSLLNCFHAFNIIVCIWNLLFISALSEISLANAFATWYWTSIKSKIPFFITTVSATRSILHHSGTAAFGAPLIIACRWIRIITNSRLRFIFASVDNFFKRFNRNVYVMCAVYGNGLCSSSLAASQLVSRSAALYSPTDTITGKIFEICKILLAFTVSCLALGYLGKLYVVLPTYPIILLILGAYSIATDFFGVYAIAVDTLVLCALDDAERNDGSSQHPKTSTSYYISEKLIKILTKEGIQDVLQVDSEF